MSFYNNYTEESMKNGKEHCFFPGYPCLSQLSN